MRASQIEDSALKVKKSHRMWEVQKGIRRESRKGVLPVWAS